MSDKIQEIRDRHAAATAGPWVWGGTPKEPYLCTKYRGRIYILVPRRSGFNGATVFLQDTEKDGCRIRAAAEFAEREVPYRDDIVGIRHPDTEFIANSWQDVLTLLAEVDRCHEAMCGLLHCNRREDFEGGNHDSGCPLRDPNYVVPWERGAA